MPSGREKSKFSMIMKIIPSTILASIVCCFCSCSPAEIEELRQRNQQLTAQLEEALEQVDIARSDALIQRDVAEIARKAFDSVAYVAQGCVEDLKSLQQTDWLQLMWRARHITCALNVTFSSALRRVPRFYLTLAIVGQVSAWRYGTAFGRWPLCWICATSCTLFENQNG